MSPVKQVKKPVKAVKKEKPEPKPLTARVEPEEVKAIPVPSETKTALPDHCQLGDDDRHRSLINLLKVLPKQYADDKKNLWAILRFEPTDEQIRLAKEAIDNEPKRDTR